MGTKGKVEHPDAGPFHDVLYIDIEDIPEIIHYLHETGVEGGADFLDPQRKFAKFYIQESDRRMFPRLEQVESVALVYRRAQHGT